MNKVLACLCSMLVTLGVSACVAKPPPPRIAPIPPHTTTTTVPPTATADRGSCAVGQLQQGGTCEPCPQMKPCFMGPWEMHFLADAVTPLIWDFSQSVYGNTIPPVPWIFIPSRQMQWSPCGPQTSDQSPAFCPISDSISLGEDGLWWMYQTGDRGDAVVFISMAHEYAHHVQAILARQNYYSAPPMDSIDSENQADCFSGAVAKDMTQKGFFTTDDLAGVENFLPQIGEKENNPRRTHGTVEERVAAFRAGFDDGLESCNDYGDREITPR